MIEEDRPKHVVAGLEHIIQCFIFLLVDGLDSEEWRKSPALHFRGGISDSRVRSARCHPAAPLIY